MAAQYTEHLHIVVTPATAARVTEEAQRRQVSISTLLRGYIADGLDGSEK